MSVRIRVVAALAIMAMVMSTVAYATPTGSSISINFGADEPDGAGSAVTGAAGLAGTVNWNNLELNEGNSALTMDVQSASMASTATVSWTSNNTWSSQGRGEENNTAPAGDDRNLMTGYLDTTDVTVTEVTVTGLDDVFTDMAYRVAVYIQGGVNGRGGQYTVTTDNKVSTLNLTTEAAFDGTYIPGGDPGNNYLVLGGNEGFTAPDFVLTATPTTGDPPRAPINGIEIVAIPEPTTIALLVFGLIGWAAVARRR